MSASEALAALSGEADAARALGSRQSAHLVHSTGPSKNTGVLRLDDAFLNDDSAQHDEPLDPRSLRLPDAVRALQRLVAPSESPIHPAA